MAKTSNFSRITLEQKEYLRGLRAIFVMAPRELSDKRLAELVKALLPLGNVVFGIAEEECVDGFEGQPQFRTLRLAAIEPLVAKVDSANVQHVLQPLQYAQANVDEVIRMLRPNKVMVIRGSYLYPFHRGSTCALLEKRGIPFEYVSPFVNEDEAKYFLHKINDELIDAADLVGESGDEQTMLGYARGIAKRSFDYSFQTGAVLAVKNTHKYEVIDAACNEVVPYQTYALLHGNAREDNRVPRQGDQTYYDTIHAEMNLLVRAMQRNIDFKGMSLFINMMPCPSCARTLVKTGLKEVVYQQVHSGGYALKLFNERGIATRRIPLEQ